jgi:iron complex transport system ATP-binding protein
MMLETTGINYHYGEKQVLYDLSLHLRKGEIVGIIGPNGSGKSTLLNVFSGVVPPSSGKVSFLGKPMESYSRKSIARRMAVLMQEPLPPISFTVKEVLQMGRFPHQNWLGTDGADLETLMPPIIAATGVEHLLERPLTALSGGERQRVAIAKAMVQQPVLLLLDEPTTFLDIGYQVQTLKLIKEWQQQCGLGVVMVLHDLNLAAHVCDRLLLLHEGRKVAEGTADQVLTSAIIDEVYKVETTVVRHPHKPLPQIWVEIG